MTTLNTLILDDELPALELLKHYVESCPELQLQQACNHPEEAMKLLASESIDLLISDIRMPEMTGLDVLRLAENKPLCIFITADPGQAVTAYELDVIDYLVKPVSLDRFRKAIQKAVDYYQFSQTKENTKDFIMLKADYRVHKIALDQLIRVEGFGEYIRVVTQHKTFTVLQRLSDFESQYASMGFIRIHKSYIVLQQHITSLKGQEITLRDGSHLPVGRVYKSALNQSF